MPGVLAVHPHAAIHAYGGLQGESRSEQGEQEMLGIEQSAAVLDDVGKTAWVHGDSQSRHF